MKNNILDIRRTPLTPVEIISLAEAKAQCIVTYSDDDALITAYIQKAIKHIENHCNISINPYTVVMTADLYVEYELPYGPVTGILGVQTRNGNEGSGPASYTSQASGWSTDGVQFVSFSPTGPVGFNSGVPFTGYFQWGPYASPYAQNPTNRYRITYTTGWPSPPDDLKQAILMQIAWLYDHRGEEDANKYDWNPGVCSPALILSDPYRRQQWH